VEEELARGSTAASAHVLARERLGTDAEILRKTLEQPALRSWGTRAPFLSGALAAPLALAASAPAVVALFVALVAIANHLPTAAQGELSGPARAAAAAAMPWLLLYGLPLGWAAMLAYYAASRRLRWYWGVVGLVLTAALGACTNFEVRWPAAGVRGQLSGGVGFNTSPANLAHFGTRWLVTCALGLALYVLLVRPRRVTSRA
jgi:hypothetical protein